jgi:hypothetical protein
MELRRPALGARRCACLLVDVRQRVLGASADVTLRWPSTAGPLLSDTLSLPFALVDADGTANYAGRCLLDFIDVREDVFHDAAVIASAPTHVFTAAPAPGVQVNLASWTTKTARRVHV